MSTTKATSPITAPAAPNPDQCAVGKDGELLDASKITWFNDPDDVTPIASSSSSPTSAMTTSSSTASQPLKKKKSLLDVLGKPAQVVGGQRRTGRPAKPRVADPNNSEPAEVTILSCAMSSYRKTLVAFAISGARSRQEAQADEDHFRYHKTAKGAESTNASAPGKNGTKTKVATKTNANTKKDVVDAPAKPHPRSVKRGAISSTTTTLGASSAATLVANTTAPKPVHATAAYVPADSNLDHHEIPDLEDVSDDEDEAVGAGGGGDSVQDVTGVEGNEDIGGETGTSEDGAWEDGALEDDADDLQEEDDDENEDEAEDDEAEMGYTYEEMKAFAEADRQAGKKPKKVDATEDIRTIFVPEKKGGMRCMVCKNVDHFAVYKRRCEELGLEVKERAIPKTIKHAATSIQSSLDPHLKPSTKPPPVTRDGLIEYLVELIITDHKALMLLLPAGTSHPLNMSILSIHAGARMTGDVCLQMLQMTIVIPDNLLVAHWSFWAQALIESTPTQHHITSISRAIDMDLIHNGLDHDNDSSGRSQRWLEILLGSPDFESPSLYMTLTQGTPNVLNFLSAEAKKQSQTWESLVKERIVEALCQAVIKSTPESSKHSYGPSTREAQLLEDNKTFVSTVKAHWHNIFQQIWEKPQNTLRPGRSRERTTIVGIVLTMGMPEESADAFADGFSRGLRTRGVNQIIKVSRLLGSLIHVAPSNHGPSADLIRALCRSTPLFQSLLSAVAEPSGAVAQPPVLNDRRTLTIPVMEMMVELMQSLSARWIHESETFIRNGLSRKKDYANLLLDALYLILKKKPSLITLFRDQYPRPSTLVSCLRLLRNPPMQSLQSIRTPSPQNVPTTILERYLVMERLCEEAKGCQRRGCSRRWHFRCKACHLTSYCGVSCQKQDWKEHRLVCGLRLKWDGRGTSVRLLQLPFRFDVT
ncbi:uncharacterized protein STEHIDRAFT_116773 [Stereum hirsutum FP-91666 SS1]|uniref:MYND-type domain-containing protein n=1 Tax=Stereum hirsutum (strain FP-91666) TaxID=721885 RepID=R7RWK4_STEHR|nr:uncharacterized protein STEHIDRAFT_116773 [Stereum hirsutum FP-91666 SS1]EIM79148.1 hypothetical protein STEHIDRAFT_116773 [Stereum hirsutum FP-91666 SS1]